MLRDWLLAPSPLVYVLIAWGIMISLWPAPVLGAPLPPQLSQGDVAGRDLETVRHTLEMQAVRQQLEALGVTPAEAEAKLARLSSDELHQLAQRAEEARAGGDEVLGALVFVLLVILLIIVILELMGRKVISR